MSKLNIGTWVDGGQVKLDLPQLLVTRMLVQANSGQGKSWALRGLLERTAGRVQQIIVDPEGEFASLREKHDLVIIAASGGDAAAHPKTAGLLAIRLLETEASAVLDISEIKADARHAFVRLFIESLMDAPKKLRHPVLFVLDEAQIFCPEKGQGESEASAAVIDIATRGRKRGLCLVAATQRVSMFHKGAAAELKNRMIGGTSQDVDVKRAAFDLGLPPAEARDSLRALEPGHFYAYGPAFAQLAPREFVTGEVHTSHPEVGQKRLNVKPPEPTAAILALLPKLADLPKEAEEQARSIDDLKKELATAKRELSIAKKAQPSAMSSVDPAIAKRAAAGIARLTAIIEELMKFIVTVTAKDFEGSAGVDVDAMRKAIEAAVAQSQRIVENSMERRNKDLKALQTEASRIVTRVRKLLETQEVRIDLEVRKNAPFTVAPKAPHTSLHDLATAEIAKASRPPKSNGHASATLPPGELATLTACIQFPEGLRREQLTVLTQYKRSSRDAYIQRLREKGLVETSGDMVKVTDEGTAALPDAAPLPTGVELQEHWMRKLPSGEAKVLQVLIDAYPAAVSRDSLTESTGFARSSRDAYLQRMKAKQLWTEPSRGEVRASEDLF